MELMEAGEKHPLQRQKLVFAVNGERFELESFDPSTTLLEFLRTCTKYKSAKLGCGEGEHLFCFQCCSVLWVLRAFYFLILGSSLNCHG